MRQPATERRRQVATSRECQHCWCCKHKTKIIDTMIRSLTCNRPTKTFWAKESGKPCHGIHSQLLLVAFPIGCKLSVFTFCFNIAYLGVLEWKCHLSHHCHSNLIKLQHFCVLSFAGKELFNIMLCSHLFASRKSHSAVLWRKHQSLSC